MDLVELQAEAVKHGYTLVNQRDFYHMGRIVDAARRHVNAIHNIMVAHLLNDETVKSARQEQLRAHQEMIEQMAELGGESK